ncbi:DEAD/DEAH box helicase family protein [Buchananella hordeovulneris]|uniref:restriction endonuclease n=1 Tax=Buchananella hordeovulneris TaxID=52770 RepID=UPI000F5FD870|nr:DEAD/DEAH box helicase family protein [Buchananella hordeovulneris]RRD44944.1 restriction endonuclease [Buchananella hordeovulneris]
MKIIFDGSQPYQLEAINAVVDLFQGQPEDADALRTLLRKEQQDLLEDPTALFRNFRPYPQLDLVDEIDAVGNNLLLDEEAILENLKMIQDRNALEITSGLVDGLQFDIEMETGTGKTYVYLRTAFELASRYHFNKFIILVPSVAIREGVNTSIQLMRDHFRHLYPQINMDALVYSGDRAEDVRDFATATSLQFMVMTIDSVKGDKNTRIIHQTRDKLSGLRPLDYLQATRPIVIMDEPQKMESQLARSAIVDLNPLCTLRYSATHRTKRNVVYRLDPLDAHRLELVKKIVLSDALEIGSVAKPYVKLLEVRRDPFKASLELVVKKKDGSYAKKKVSAAQGADLERLSGGNPAYAGSWRIHEISVQPEQIELTNYGYLRVGEAIGDNQDAVFREMIRETIREHVHKEIQVHKRGIKVLSLFFIDKVSSYLGEGTNNLDASGFFAEAFDTIYREEREKNPATHAFLPADPVEARSGYFAQMKAGKGKNAPMTFKDSSGNTRADDEAYELIMKDKIRLLSMDEPVRFIFSHSTLREGWDNPNVFQICTLRDMSTEAERRQTIGRGLRLPVNQNGERIKDTGVAQLTVVANESYKAFAAALQDEYRSAGVAIGCVRKTEFAGLPAVDPITGNETRLGTRRSGLIYDSLLSQGYINTVGEVLGTWMPEQLEFTINLPDEFAGYEDDIIRIVDDCKIEKIVKAKRKRVARKFNKQVCATPEFEEFWEAITARTTYRVALDREDLIARSIVSIKQAPRIDPIRIQVTRTGLEITRGGPKGMELGSRSTVLTDSYPLPDIISQLQEATSLTRRTIIDILLGSGRIGDFLANPNDFIKMVAERIKTELAHTLIDSIQYEPIGGSIYELRELQADGVADKDRFIDQLYQVTNTEKTDFDYLVIDSAVERQFAQCLDGREDIKLFMKLPDKFRVPTPVGDYNPDWAIIKVEDGVEHLYLVRETKSSQNPIRRRPSENAKIKAALKHFAAIGVDYKVSTPERWEI